MNASDKFTQRKRHPGSNYYRDQESKQSPPLIDKKILVDGIKDIQNLKEWGHYLAEGNEGEKVKTTQLRKFFGAVKKIQADFDHSKAEIILLNPKLAYAVGKIIEKNKNSKIKALYNLLSPLIDDINEDKSKFKNFVNVFEAIVAYHKEKEKDLSY